MIAKVHQNTNVPQIFFNAGKTHNRWRGFSKVTKSPALQMKGR
jgi:hypothetical protein